ncbi:MAG: hypothetical protein ABJL44_18585 [Algibacter sp.]
MNKDLQSPQQSEEVDLGQLFKLIGNVFERLFRFIGNIFYKVFLAFVWMVFFVKKHIIKIGIAGIIGMGYGFFKQNKGEPVYKSTTVIKQNYETGENLYRAIDYYNELISEEDSVTLGNIFKINSAKAASIIGLSIEAIINENEKLVEYDLYIKSLDSVLASNVTLEMYVNNSKEYQYPNQRIMIKAKEKDVFEPIINRIVNSITETKFFVIEQKKDLEELISLEKIILESISASKELQEVYKDVLTAPLNDDTKGIQASIRIDNTEDKYQTKEFELYNSDVELRREFVKIQRKKEDKRNILEVISSQENQGTIDNSKEFFGVMIDSKVYYTIILMMLTCIILLSIYFIKFLEEYRDKVS